MVYAYARVSAQDQNLTRQIDAFLKYGVEKSNIYCDKKSGKDFDRGSYRELTDRLKAGDLLIIKSIDRLGRNYDGIIAEWSKIVNVIGADIFVLDMPLLDTRMQSNTLVGKFISDVVLQVLSFVAENERANIKARQAEGICAARERGVRFGRPRAKYTREFIDIARKYMEKRVPLKDALDRVGMTQENFYYHVRKLKKEKSAH